MLNKLLKPANIAVVGFAGSKGTMGRDVTANLKKCGFEGKVYPISPESGEISGMTSYPDLGSCPNTPDLCVIAVPAAMVPSAAKQAAYSGVGSIIVLSSGFREAGQNGLDLENQLLEVCSSRNIPLMGPNCTGIINTHHHMNASLSPACPQAGGISVISQSGALFVTILDWATKHNIGLGKVISLGNKAGLTEIDFLKALAEDEQTKVIVCYLENIDKGDEFLQSARYAADIKPVVVLKAGMTEAGAKAASLHTGSLAGGDIAYGAALKRAGIIRAKRLDELLDFAQAFAAQPLPGQGGIGVVTNSGGVGIMAADAVESSGLSMTCLKDSTMKKLGKCLPRTAAVNNPVDVMGDSGPDRFEKALRILLDDPGVQAVLVLATPQKKIRPLSLAGRIARLSSSDKPVLTALVGGKSMERARNRLSYLQIPHYPSLERAAGTLCALFDYSAWKMRPPRKVTRFPVNHSRVSRVLRWHERMGLSRIAEVEAKAILQAYGFRIPQGGMVSSAEDAAELARRIGYPVVMKIVSSDVVQKSDYGGVRLGLVNSEQVRDAFDLIHVRIKRRAPDVDIRGIYIEKMVPAGREVILGMSRDPVFGPMLMFGLGGIFVEVMKDVTFHLAPITSEEALQMLKATRSYSLLLNTRGRISVDIDSIALGLQRISQLAMEYPQITELDINPFTVGEVGVEPFVTDARMSLKHQRHTNE